MKKELAALIESNVPEPYFLVEVQVVMMRNLPKIKVLIDSDAGISIDECGVLSRHFSKMVDESLFTDDYELEVSSPGIGSPLVLERQYIKNIGKHLKVTARDGTQIKGKLNAYLPGQKLVLETVSAGKNKKNSVPQLVDVPLETIKKAIIEVTF